MTTLPSDATTGHALRDHGAVLAWLLADGSSMIPAFGDSRTRLKSSSRCTFEDAEFRHRVPGHRGGGERSAGDWARPRWSLLSNAISKIVVDTTRAGCETGLEGRALSQVIEVPSPVGDDRQRQTSSGTAHDDERDPRRSSRRGDRCVVEQWALPLIAFVVGGAVALWVVRRHGGLGPSDDGQQSPVPRSAAS
jgi:hypothetical protein